MRMVVPLLVCLALFGCAAPAVISDISDSSLKVQANSYTPMSEVDAAARNGCGQYGKTPAAISYQCLDQYCVRKSFLFACK